MSIFDQRVLSRIQKSLKRKQKQTTSYFVAATNLADETFARTKRTRGHVLDAERHRFANDVVQLVVESFVEIAGGVDVKMFQHVKVSAQSGKKEKI